MSIMARLPLPSLAGLLPWLLVIGAQPSYSQTCWRDTQCSSISTAAFPGSWESNIFAPESRIVNPAVLLGTDGKQISTYPSKATLDKDKKAIVFDFGYEVGGVATIDYTVSSTEEGGTIGLAFTEAKNWIGPVSDSSTGLYDNPEVAIYANNKGTGDFSYVMPVENLRGGFRYMTVFTTKDMSVEIHNVSLEITFQPTWSNLRAYQGYFHSSDDLLNKIWYSGAYTLQTNSIHPATGRAWPAPTNGTWLENGMLGPGNTILTDGAKRDRTVWPGDMGVAVPAAFYSTGDIESTRNALQSLYELQDSSTGQLPFAGKPLRATGSTTYHLWTMLGTYNYVFFSDDTDFLKQHWDGYKAAMKWAQGEVDSSGLLYGKSKDADWGRLWPDGTTTSIQALFYRTLATGATLAKWAGDADGTGDAWLKQANDIKSLTSQRNWDSSAGAFFDSADRKNIHPQDGNSLAVLFGIVGASSNEASGISSYLKKNWTPIGAECEELPGEISPFVSSFEIQAHLLAGQTQRALDLIRTSWGWYLNNPLGTQSTMIEGYLINGTFGYRWDAGYQNSFSYTSHSHGWATGPVTALTEHIVGLSVTGRGGSTWRLAPQVGDLSHAEGGFVTKRGRYSASWTRETDGAIKVEYAVPEGTEGEVSLPLGANVDPAKVTVNGKAFSGRKRDGATAAPWRIEEAPGGRRVLTMRSSGGKHTISVR
ncbi:glycoside hydrolase family 78 protein [Apiospora arundinis]|uniref:Glycoside hydrolase family 78 protein n=1 Tax=Apiospora arundinis TaxID=335852 RepID=A0ABR2I093_9PEZI